MSRLLYWFLDLHQIDGQPEGLVFRVLLSFYSDFLSSFITQDVGLRIAYWQ